MTSNKAAHSRFAGEVLVEFLKHGFLDAHRPPEPKGLGPNRHRHGDLLGLPVTTAIRNSRTLDMAAAVDEAKKEADAEGKPVHVTITPRRDCPVEDSYVITDLATWLRLLERLHPEAVRPR